MAKFVSTVSQSLGHQGTVEICGNFHQQQVPNTSIILAVCVDCDDVKGESRRILDALFRKGVLVEDMTAGLKDLGMLQPMLSQQADHRHP